MPSIAVVASRDETRPLKIRIGEGDKRAEFHINFYPNRITQAPLDVQVPDDVDLKDLTDEEFDALKAASRLPEFIESWDMEGPLYDNRGKLVINPETGEAIGTGVIIPLDPRVLQHLPSPIVVEVTNAVMDTVFPHLKQSRNERRRSRSGR